jgi:hypothetical protein
MKGPGCPHGCEILLFAYNCAVHPTGMPFITNVKVVYYPPNAKSMLQPLDLGITQVFQPLVRKHQVQKLVYLTLWRRSFF